MADLLTSKQLADYLKKPVATIHAWRRRRVGPPGFRLGRDIVYRRTAVDAWLEELEAADQELAAARARRSMNGVTAHPAHDSAPGFRPGALPTEKSTSTSANK